MIVGLDEVGRGCWAGPLCVAAVVLGDASIDGLTDSKLLSKKKREYFAARIIREASSVGIGWVSAAGIDKIGLSKALTYAADTALSQITTPYEEIILDGTHNFLSAEHVTVMKKADLLIPAVSAASLVAKVARDEYMARATLIFSDYGFESHVGYGTKQHQLALDEHGPCLLHRMSFAPMSGSSKGKTARTTSIPTTGSQGESAAADYVRSLGFAIIERNWKNKWCEIDLIATKGTQTHFIEVKYRKDTTAGSGFEYITKQKQRQMRFAAEYWLLKNGTAHNRTYVLSAVELSGEKFTVDNFVTII